MQFVFLVGGKGTRLGKATSSIPKPLISVAGRPFIQHLIEEARRFGIRRVLLLAGHLGSQFEAAIPPGSVEGVDVEIVIEPEPLGTGGALRHAADRLDSRFFMANGDSFFLFNFLDLARAPADSEFLGTLALRRLENADRFGVVELDGEKIVGFAERGSGEGLINGGTYFLDREILSSIGPGMQSLERDIFPVLAKSGRLSGRVYDGDFIDIGVPDDLAAAQTLIPEMRRRPAAFFDRDGTLNVDHGYVHRRDQFDWISGARTAIKRLNDAGYFTIVVTNQAGVAHGYYDEDAIHALHTWINDELRQVGAHIDAFYHCPHHPHAKIEKYRADSPDRKPNPGMLLRARAEWPIDWSRSFMVGDRETDMDAALAADLRGYQFPGGNLDDFIENYVLRRAGARQPSQPVRRDL